MKIGVIGGGKVGCCLAGYLKQELQGITASSEAHSLQLAERFGLKPCTNVELVQRADVLLLTVPDRLIGTVAASLASASVSEHATGSAPAAQVPQ